MADLNTRHNGTGDMNGGAMTEERAGFWGRVLALIIAVPIYFSLVVTLPALAAVLVLALYFGVPVAVRRAVTDPAYEAPSIQ